MTSDVDPAESVELFINCLTKPTEGESLPLKKVEAAYIIYCEIVGFTPANVPDIRRYIEHAGPKTSPDAVLEREWDGFEDHIIGDEATRTVADRYDPMDPDLDVNRRNHHVYEYADRWRTPLREAMPGADSVP